MGPFESTRTDPRHQRPLAVGRDREHFQRLHIRQDRQSRRPLVTLQIVRHVHHRFGGNRITLGVVESK